MEDYQNMELNELRDALYAAQAIKDEATKQEKAIKDEILFRHAEQLSGNIGTLTIGEIRFNTPKKIEWDQEKLASLYSEIGETAPEYIDVKYSVSENKYKNWPSAIADQFESARTVKTGSTTIEFIEGK